jgi:hypothetical protein
MNIKELVEQSFATALDKGWHQGVVQNRHSFGLTTYPTTIDANGKPHPRVVDVDYVGCKLMLAVSELSEALEELRAGRAPTIVYWQNPTSDDKPPIGVNINLLSRLDDGIKPECWARGPMGNSDVEAAMCWNGLSRRTSQRS